jgi:hypothetical protein
MALFKRDPFLGCMASELRAIGVTEQRADIYRWASRFRIAKSFEAVQLSKAANMKAEQRFRAAGTGPKVHPQVGRPETARQGGVY